MSTGYQYYLTIAEGMISIASRGKVDVITADLKRKRITYPRKQVLQMKADLGRQLAVRMLASRLRRGDI